MPGLVASDAYASTVLNMPGLVAHYRMDSGSTIAYDESRNHADGAWKGTLGGQGGGKFNGTDNYVDLGKPTAFPTTGACSLVARIYLAASFASGYKSVIGEWRDAAGNRSYLLALGSAAAGKNGAVAFNDINAAFLSTQAQSFFIGKWSQLVYTLPAAGSGQTLSLYVNGVLSNSGANSAVTSSSLSWFIGNHTTQNTFWNGWIRDVSVFNRGLTANEARNLDALGRVA